MAVEATHLNLFPPQFVQSRENLMNLSQQDDGVDAYNQQQQIRLPPIPFPVISPGNCQPFYQQLVWDSTQPKTSINSESGITCNVPASRNSVDELRAGANFSVDQKKYGVSFAGDNMLPQIHEYQLEIDAVVTEHTKKIRLEMQQRQIQQAKQLVATIGESMMKTLKEKEYHIQKMARLNLMLQEKVKNLYMENQLWRDLAHTNEATVNYLRGEFELALAQAGTAEKEEEAESCGSSNHVMDDINGGDKPYKEVCYRDRRCCMCGEGQCSVLLLPCRHLCLCSVCGSGCHQLQTCPVCDSSMTATLHVNMS